MSTANGEVPAPLPRGMADTLAQALRGGLPPSVRRFGHTVTDLPAGAEPGAQRLALQITTDGTATPAQALGAAVAGLQMQLQAIVDLVPRPAEAPGEQPERQSDPAADRVWDQADPLLACLVSDLGLGVRALNCLHSCGIATVGELLSRTPAALLRTPNFGRRCLLETEQALAGLGLALGALAPGGPVPRR